MCPDLANSEFIVGGGNGPGNARAVKSE